MVSFYVISLYTKVHVKEAITIISNITNVETSKLVKIYLKYTYFTFCDEFNEQTDGVAMGSPLSPVVANIYMEDFEKKANESFSLKPRN